jgi:hypothetical protein
LFATGFETTAPANATAVIQARELGLENFSVLVGHVTVPPRYHGDPRFAQESRAGIPGGRPRLHRYGLPGIRAAGRALPHRDHHDLAFIL